MKKILTGSIIGTLLFAGIASADVIYEKYDPETELYVTVRILEEVEYDLTEDATEKALLQDEYAEKRLYEISELISEGKVEEAEKLIEDYNEHLDEIEKNLEEASENEAEITEIVEAIKEKNENRNRNLLALLERENLPEQAKAGIRKALENKERARLNHLAAKNRVDEEKIIVDDEITEAEVEVIEVEVLEEEATNLDKGNIKELKKESKLEKKTIKRNNKALKNKDNKPDHAWKNER